MPARVQRMRPAESPTGESKSAMFRSFGWTMPVEVFGLTGIMELVDPLDASRPQRRVVITLAGESDKLTRIDVDVVSKTTGTIAYQSFRFSDYLVCDASRASNPRAVPAHPRIWNDNEWYIAPPVSTEPIVAAVESWIEMWR